ncbi:twinfilin [Harmonia axyridis]|uniref:twinfilin n=1 Tax=Harmonia axyridis TaxID=115357 RepID=UPI001E279357|nr:twinfilin [Harmonia axyridis]
MSHQTGIHANEELKKYFAKSRNGNVRVIKVSIKNEELTLDGHHSVKNNWENDYDQSVLPLIEDDQPCYILYRLDSKVDKNYEWLFISWSPDTAPIRQKMLYASTKATLKQEFGSAQVKEDLHGTVKSEITLNGYIKYKKNAIAPAPLTSREEELQEIKKSEVHTDYNVDSKQQTLGGVSFPITASAKSAVEDMLNGLYDYLQFKIDMENEKIDISFMGKVTIEELPTKVPTDSARYHLFNFKHNHLGSCIETMVFIYSMPGYTCPIRERMLYSSCKNPLINTICSLGLNIEKKIEIDSGAELTASYLYDEVHPTKTSNLPKFAKPKGPPNRGPKRMTKPQQK